MHAVHAHVAAAGRVFTGSAAKQDVRDWVSRPLVRDMYWVAADTPLAIAAMNDMLAEFAADPSACVIENDANGPTPSQAVLNHIEEHTRTWPLNTLVFSCCGAMSFGWWLNMCSVRHTGMLLHTGMPRHVVAFDVNVSAHSNWKDAIATGTLPSVLSFHSSIDIRFVRWTDELVSDT